MAEEVEVNVRQIEEHTTNVNGTQVVEVMRKLLLAAIGAIALSRDEVENFISRLVERGELAQKDGEKLLNEMIERLRLNAPPETPNLGEQIENNFELFLNRLNIPSKRDIDDLSAKIAQLAARVEELRRTQGQEAPQNGDSDQE